MAKSSAAVGTSPSLQLSFPTGFLQKAEYDAALVGLVRLSAVAIAAVSMDKAGRKILLFVSGMALSTSPTLFPREALIEGFSGALQGCRSGNFSTTGLRKGGKEVSFPWWWFSSSAGAFPGSCHGQDHSPIILTVLLPLSTAGVMLVSNLTMGLYIYFVPASHNSTNMPNMTLVSSAHPPAEPTNYITLIPLLATMFFIMGKCREHRAGHQPGEGVSHARQGDVEQGD